MKRTAAGGKRLVFHTASLRGGGAERVAVLMANEMADRGHDVVLLTWNAAGPNAALLSPSVRLVDFGMPIRGEGYGKPATIKGVWRSARFFSRHKPDAVFSAPEFANLLMALSLVLARCPARFFPSFHAAAALPAQAQGARMAITLSKFVAWRATTAIAVSHGVGNELQSRGFAAAKVRVIHNPVLRPVPQTEKPTEIMAPWRARLAALGDAPVVVTAGRLVAVKDHRTLLKACALLRQNRPLRIAIFGEGPLEAELRDYAAALGLGDCTVFAGYVENPADCYAVADVFALSSRSEGFGNVLVEAMAAGIPVVSTDAPYGPREILDNGRLGPLSPVGEPEALASAIAAMLDRPTPADALRARADDFAVEKVGDDYEALV